MIRKMAGMTLIELMITVAVIGILAAVAAPAYFSYLEKARRADAMEALLDIRVEQEKFRRNNIAYSAGIDPTGADTTLLNILDETEYYDLSIVSSTATGFVADATPKNTSAQANDDCGIFRIDQDGAVTDVAGRANARCWHE